MSPLGARRAKAAMWKRNHGGAIEAPPDERGGITDMFYLTPPRHISTLPIFRLGHARLRGPLYRQAAPAGPDKCHFRTERLQNRPKTPTSSLTSEFHCGARARRYRRPWSRVGRSTHARGHDLNCSTGAAGFPKLEAPSSISWENYQRRPRCLIHFSSADLDPRAFC